MDRNVCNGIEFVWNQGRAALSSALLAPKVVSYKRVEICVFLEDILEATTKVNRKDNIQMTGSAKISTLQRTAVSSIQDS